MKCVKKRGQATLLVLLLGLLGLTLAMSSISRSLSDVHQSIQSDTGSRALAAAEAAAEYATTQNVNPSSNCASYTSISSIPISDVRTLDYASCAQSQSNISYSQVGVSNVAIANLTGVSANLLQVLWDNTSSVDISVLSTTNSLSRYAFNGVGSTNTANNFATAVNASACNTNTCSIPAGFSSCAQIPMTSGTTKLVRVRPFYGSTPIQICAATAPGGGNGVSIGNSVYLYIGRATMTDGTVKRVQLTKTPGAISGVFDYSLYSEQGTISK